MVNQNKGSYPLEEILAQYSDTQVRSVFQNLFAIELTSGCSVGCDFCGFDAERGVSASISFSQIEMLTERFGDVLAESKPILYWASDPLDWKEANKTYADVNRLFEEKVGYHPFISTAVPIGREETMIDLLLSSKLDRISISHMNYQRLKKAFMEKYPDLADSNKSFVVSDNDSQRSVNFEDKSNEFGEQSWVKLVSALQISNNGQGYVFTQDGSRVNSRFQRVGRIFDPSETLGIGCHHGTLLRQTGFYNAEVVTPNKDNPIGVVYRKIDPDNFFVWDKWFSPDRAACCFTEEKFREIHSVAPKAELIKPIPAYQTGLSEHKSLAQSVLTVSAYHLAHMESGNQTSASYLWQIVSLFGDSYQKKERKNNPLDDPYYVRVMNVLEEVERTRVSYYDKKLAEFRKAKAQIV